MENKNIIEILRAWLEANGYDGLCDGDECGCWLYDLCPCEQPSFENCRAAYKHGKGYLYFEKETPDA